MVKFSPLVRCTGPDCEALTQAPKQDTPPLCGFCRGDRPKRGRRAIVLNPPKGHPNE